VQNNFSKYPKANICATVVAFYNEDEITIAKSVLFAFADSLDPKLPGMPRCINRKQSDNKKRLDVDDVINLYTLLDTAKSLSTTYVAANLARVPTVSPGEMDLYAVASSVMALSNQVQSLLNRVTMVEQNGCKKGLVEGFQGKVQSSGDLTTAPDEPSAEKLTLVSHQQESKLSISETSEVGWNIVARKKPQAPKIKGTSGHSMIKGVPRKKRLAAFVSRLALDTTDNDLRVFLEAAGLKDVTCRKIKPKSDAVFKTSAFFVSCNDECQELFYDESVWPEGVELRDWIFHS
jgi:hypothetical protein